MNVFTNTMHYDELLLLKKAIGKKKHAERTAAIYKFFDNHPNLLVNNSFYYFPKNSAHPAQIKLFRNTIVARKYGFDVHLQFFSVRKNKHMSIESIIEDAYLPKKYREAC